MLWCADRLSRDGDGGGPREEYRRRADAVPDRSAGSHRRDPPRAAARTPGGRLLSFASAFLGRSFRDRSRRGELSRSSLPDRRARGRIARDPSLPVHDRRELSGTRVRHSRLMPRPLGILLSACVVSLPMLAPALHAQEADVRAVTISGAHELSDDTIRRAIRVQVGDPLPESPDRIAETVTRRYHNEGYTFAHADVAFDSGTGTLTVKIDEGVIDGVEFEGVDDPSVAQRFAEEFALRAGDVFNRKRAMQALEVLLRQTRGSIRPGRLYFRDTRDLGSRRSTFDLVDRNGRRVLLIGL